MMKRVVYPLFFLVLVLVIFLPSSSVHASTIPIYVSSVEKDCATPTSSCVAPSINTNAGDTLMVSVVCWGQTLPTLGDSLNTVFTNTVTISASFPSVWTGTSSGGADIVSLTGSCPSSLGEHIAVDLYRFVTGIGVTNKDTSTQSCTPCPDSLTMIIQPNSFIYEMYAVGNTGSTCAAIAASSGQTIRSTYSCDAVGGTREVASTMDRQYSNGGSTTSTATTGAMAGSSQLGHITVELLASGGSVTQVSNCYGNCGTPAVTSANTNSTKSINFNITQTWFYENQITFPALIINMSAQIACSYGTAQCPFAETLTLGLWATQTQCFGAVAFTTTCPAQLVASSQVTSPTKGLFTFSVNFGVFTGQWIALGFTGSRSGLQINDTNTAVPIFNTSGFPATLSNTAPQGTSKAEVYAWAVGNTIIGGGIIPANGLCSQAVDFICTMKLAACGLTPSNCLIGAIVLGLFWSITTIFALEIGLFKLHMTTGLPGGIYILIFVSWMSAWTIAVGNLWFVILEILIVVYLFTTSVVGLASGTHRMGSGSATA